MNERQRAAHELAQWQEKARLPDWHLHLSRSDICKMLDEIERLRNYKANVSSLMHNLNVLQMGEDLRPTVQVKK